MKTKRKLLLISAIAMIALVAIGIYGIDATVSFLFAGASGTIITAEIVGVAGPASAAVKGALTAEALSDAALLDNDLDRLIVKVRPTDFPLDTFSRELKNTQRVRRSECGGYEVGTRDISDTVVEAYKGGDDTINLKVGKKAMWQKNDTILIPGILGGDGNPLMLYVAGKDSATSTLQVVAANPVADVIPAIALESGLIRLGKAMSEIDAQTEAFSALPSPRLNFTQIHMAQIEESVLAGLQKKLVNFDFSTQKEQAVWEMRRGMEFTNIFGNKSLIVDPVTGKKVYTSAGVWNQVTAESEYDQTTAPTNKTFTSMSREIFDGNNGSDRRLLMAGSGFIEWLAQVPNYAKQIEAKNVEVIHGVKVLKIITDFGELLVRPMTNLFLGTYADCAIALDMSYIVKYVQEELQTKDLDLDASGQRRVKAQRLLENYALFVENLPVHRKFVPTPAEVVPPAEEPVVPPAEEPEEGGGA